MAARAPNNAAPPAPVVCTVPPVVTADMPVHLDATEPLVVSTAFLPWEAHPAGRGVATVSLPTSRGRCRWSASSSLEAGFPTHLETWLSSRASLCSPSNLMVRSGASFSPSWSRVAFWTASSPRSVSFVSLGLTRLLVIPSLSPNRAHACMATTWTLAHSSLLTR